MNLRIKLKALRFLWRRNYNFSKLCPDLYLQCKSVYLVCWVSISSLRARNLPKLTAASTIGLAHLVLAAQGVACQIKDILGCLFLGAVL